MKKNKKSNDAILKLNVKPHSLYGIVAFVFSVMVIIGIFTTIIMSASKDPLSRQQVILIGVIGWVSAMLNLAGFGIAIISEGAKDMNKIFAHIALLLNGLCLIYHGYVIWYGFF